MGRMADARKRARRKKVGEAPSPDPAAPEAPTPTAEPDAEPPDQAAEELVFPEDPEPSSARRGAIVLPSSGLASDILASEAARELDVEPLEPGLDPSASAADPSGAQNFSFFSAPAREEKAAVEATEHLATFYLASEEYGLPVKLVQEIIRVTEITQVPRAPEFIKGVINLRGRIIPVVDLSRKLGLGDVKTTRQTRIVVVGIHERLIGLLVDGASQVLRVPVTSIEAAPDEVVEIDTNFIRGVAKLEKRLIILVDLQRVLARELGVAAEAG